MTGIGSAPVTFVPNDPFGFRSALEANQPKIDADQAEFLANFNRNMNRTTRRRAGASAAGPRQRATAAATNTGETNAQAPLFGPAVVQQVAPSSEQVALKRQRLTTIYDPISPPADDPTTAEGVRMGVVTDHDGRHWRQQSMRLGRWITSWKDMYPYASEPVDVDELTKGEKYWLDIKFRRWMPVRRTPMKMAPGRGCTGRYWSLRRGNRGIQSGRVNKVSAALPTRKPGPRKDDGPEETSGAADDPDDVFGLPRQSFYRPLRGSTTRRRNPVLTAPLIKDILGHFGIKTNGPEALESQLRALLPDDLFAHPHFAEEAHYPKVEDISPSVLTKMRGIIRTAGLATTESTAPKTIGSRPQPDKMQQATTRAQERQQFEKDILSEAGLTYSDLPSSFRREMTSNILLLQNAGHPLNAELRTAAAISAGTAAAAAAAAATGAADPVFVDGALAALDQNRHWAEDEEGNLYTHPADDPEHRNCSAEQLRRLVVQADDDLTDDYMWVERRDVRTGVRLYVREDRTSGYMAVGRRSPEPTRMLTLMLSNGVEMRIPESSVGTIPQHAHTVIIRCDPGVSDREAPSTRLVDILHEGQRLSVPHNKLGNYLNATIAPAVISNAARMLSLSIEPTGPGFMVAEALVGTLPEHTNAIIRSCYPAVDASEPASQRLVRVRYNGVLKRVPDNQVGNYIGGLVNPSDETTKLAIPLGTIDLLRSDGVEINVPISYVDNCRFGDATIVSNSNPPASKDDQPSARMVLITLQTEEGNQTVLIPDNHLGLYEGCTISQPRPIVSNRLVQLKVSLGGKRSLAVAKVNNWQHKGNVVDHTQPDYDPLEIPSERLVHISTRPDRTEIAVPDNQLGRYPGSVILTPPTAESSFPVEIDQSRVVVLTLSNGREVKVPIGSVSAEHYNGARINHTIPERNLDEPESERLVHVSRGNVHAEVPDNVFERHRAWFISHGPTSGDDAGPEDSPTGVRNFTACAKSGFQLTA